MCRKLICSAKTPGPRWSGPFRGIKLLKSKDNGNAWYRVDRNGNERKIGPQDNARDEVNPNEHNSFWKRGL